MHHYYVGDLCKPMYAWLASAALAACCPADKTAACPLPCSNLCPAASSAVIYARSMNNTCALLHFLHMAGLLSVVPA